MTIYTLYVKTHRKTGLKYLGQTSQNPFKYPGSGTDWKDHIKKFGKDIDTEILLQTPDKEERNRLGRYYSTLWHVVTASDDFGNKLWANKIPETGGGGGGQGIRSQKSIDDFIERVITHHKKMMDDGTHPTKQKWTCEHCGTSGTNLLNYHNSHGDNCPSNPNINLSNVIRKQETSKLLSDIQKKAQLRSVEEGTHNTQTKWHCVYCGLNGMGAGNYRFHGDNCLLNPNLSREEIEFRKQKSANNPMKNPEVAKKLRDQNKYDFINKKTGEVKTMTRWEFIDLYGCKSCQVTIIIKNKNKSLYGWSVA